MLLLLLDRLDNLALAVDEYEAPAGRGHVGNHLPREDSGFFRDGFGVPGVGPLVSGIRVAARGDEEGEMDESVRERTRS